MNKAYSHVPYVVWIQSEVSAILNDSTSLEARFYLQKLCFIFLQSFFVDLAPLVGRGAGLSNFLAYVAFELADALNYMTGNHLYFQVLLDIRKKNVLLISINTCMDRIYIVHVL